MSDNKSNIDIPAAGSLGLLAYGDLGLEAWRKKREEEKSKKKPTKDKGGKDE